MSAERLTSSGPLPQHLLRRPHPRAPRAPGVPWTAGISQVLWCAVASIGALAAIYGMAQFLLSPRPQGMVPLLGTALVWVGFLSLFCHAALHRGNVILQLAPVHLVVVGVAVVVLGDALSGAAGWGWLATLSVSAAAYASIALAAPWALAGSAAIAATLALASMPAHQATSGLWELAVVTATALTAGMAARGVRRAVVSGDSSVLLARRAAETLSAELAHERMAQEFERFVHDHVLHAFHAISMERELVPEERVRQIARDALESLEEQEARLDGPPGRVGLANVAAGIRASVERCGIDVQVKGLTRAFVPGDVCDAVVAAALEALRNVERHSGVGAATVTVRGQGLGVRVTVSDDGKGWDPRGPHGRFGVRRSIEERLTEVGATVVIRGAPGQGVTVDMSWRPLPDLDGTHDKQLAGGLLRPAMTQLVVAMFPSLGWVLLACALNASALQRPWVAWTLSVGAVGLAALEMPRGLRAGLSRSRAQALLLVALALSVSNGLLLAPDDFNARHYWLAGPCVTFILYVILLRPPREAVPLAMLTGAAPAFIILSHHPTPSQMGAMVGCLVSAPVVLVVGFGLRYVIDGLAGRVANTVRANAFMTSRQIAAQDTRAQIREAVAVLRDTATPLLSGVRDGTIDATAERTRESAQRLEASLRDELMLKDVPHIRRSVYFARENGWRVRVKIHGRVSSVVEARMATTIARVVDVVAAGGSMEVTITDAGAVGGSSLVVTPFWGDAAAFSESVLRGSGQCQVVDGQLLLRLQGPSPELA